MLIGIIQILGVTGCASFQSAETFDRQLEPLYLQNINQFTNNLELLETEVQHLVSPPQTPYHTATAEGEPKIIQVRLVVEEKQVEIEDDVFITTMTFNGTIPGPLIIAHEGDYVEVTLENPTFKTHLHNVDFHAATGALGGGSI